MRAAKSAIERGHSLSLSDGLAIERECYDTTLYTEDRDEELAAHGIHAAGLKTDDDCKELGRNAGIRLTNK